MFRSRSRARPEPLAPTDCEYCRNIERGPLRTRMAGLYEAFLDDGPMRPSEYLAVAGMAPIIAAMAGGGGPTPYEKHRQRWIDTGEPVELERMLRHDLPKPSSLSPAPRPRRKFWHIPAVAVPVHVITAVVMLAGTVWLVHLTGWLW